MCTHSRTTYCALTMDMKLIPVTLRVAKTGRNHLRLGYAMMADVASTAYGCSRCTDSMVSGTRTSLLRSPRRLNFIASQRLFLRRSTICVCDTGDSGPP